MGFNELIGKLFGNKNTRDMREIQPWVEKIKKAYPAIEKLSNDELRAKTQELKERIKQSAVAENAKIVELKAKVEKMDARVADVEIKYNWTTACPTYYRPTVQKLLDKKYLSGDSKGQLKLTEQMIRTLVILDRAGVFD